MNTLENNWQHLLPVIKELYKEKGVKHDHIREDLQYLRTAYFEVEAFWNQVLEKIKEVKLVLFGEAPLYGSEKSYFYNPATCPTSFFTYKNAEEVVGGLTESKKLTDRGGIPRKLEMLQKLSQAGLLIVDLFPFSFNEECHYNYPKRYRLIDKNLFTSTIEYHLACKLRAILPKMTQSTQFAFRFKKLEKLEYQTLCTVNTMMGRSLCSIGSIGGTNIPMNQSKLRHLWSTSTTK